MRKVLAVGLRAQFHFPALLPTSPWEPRSIMWARQNSKYLDDFIFLSSHRFSNIFITLTSHKESDTVPFWCFLLRCSESLVSAKCLRGVLGIYQGLSWLPDFLLPGLSPPQFLAMLRSLTTSLISKTVSFYLSLMALKGKGVNVNLTQCGTLFQGLNDLQVLLVLTLYNDLKLFLF